ncbi:MAG: transcriptional repressor [Elusimicrobia bacterium]|nr:transcriptional repressor [Elusimicrobiota bacterium]
MKETAELVYFPTWTAGRKGYAERIRQLFEEYLNEKGLKQTTQRQAILDYLLQASRHLSQEDIYRALKSRGIGRVTVFRALKTLEDCGLVARVSGPGAMARYEVKKERPHHDHLICVDCGAILEVRWPEVERLQDRTCRDVEFTPLWHRHEIFGRCKNCGQAPGPVTGRSHPANTRKK